MIGESKGRGRERGGEGGGEMCVIMILPFLNCLKEMEREKTAHERRSIKDVLKTVFSHPHEIQCDKK
jgi:hypothetical protein